MGYPHYDCKDYRHERGDPEIVCLCGSSRFRQEYEREADRLTHDGCIVLTIHCFKGQHGDPFDVDCREQLDELHKRKIDLADRVFVINVGGYIGDSTRNEIAYAEKHHIPVEYLDNGPLIAAIDAALAGAEPPADCPDMPLSMLCQSTTPWDGE